ITSTGATKAITFNEKILLGADSTLSTNNGAITLTAITTSAANTNTISVDSGTAAITIGGDIGTSGTRLNGINLRTTAALSIANNLFASGRIILTASGATNAGKVVTAGSLLLQGNGTFTLITDIGTLAANTGAGVVTITENNALIIDTVANLVPTNINGITSGGQNVVINTGNLGLITLNQPIDAGGGKVILNPDGGQTGTGLVSAAQLLLQGKGPFNLTTAIGDLAANTTAGSIRVSDTNGINVNTVTDASATAVNGVNSGGQNVELITGNSGQILLTQALNAGAGKVILNPDGGQAGGGLVTAAQLLLLGRGPFNLQTAVTDLAAFTANGSIKVTETSGLVINTVQDSALTNISGLDSTNQLIELITTAGSITLTQGVTAGTNKVILNANAGASGAGTVGAAHLLLLGGGGYNLNTNVSSL
ncbi:MAG: hypothetical protein AAB289_03030, partial [Chloroflexota bacterium]